MSRGTKKTFFSYVIPSVLSFALSGIYTIVDGFFIGQSMQDIGIAAVTIGFPISAFIQAIGTGIGLAGAIQYSISIAKKDISRSEEYFTATSALMFVVSTIITLLLYRYTGNILTLFGATGVIHSMASEYVRVIVLGTFFQLFATGLVPFIRNMGGSTFAMISMILGFITNIILDYVFVWVLSQGMFGAALATVIGQGVTLICAIVFLIHKKTKLKFTNLNKYPSIWLGLLQVSISPFGLSFSSQLTLLLMNRFLFKYGTDQDVAIYGCIDYIIAIIYLLVQGVGDGSQPLISFYYGKKDKQHELEIRRLSYYFAGFLTIFCSAIVFLFRNKIGFLFGATASTNHDVAIYLPYFLATILFLCYTRITTSYLYATEKTKFSYILVYGESVSALILLNILPKFLGIQGVWLAIPASQVLLFFVSFILKSIITKKS